MKKLKAAARRGWVWSTVRSGPVEGVFWHCGGDGAKRRFFCVSCKNCRLAIGTEADIL
ncbi:MAG: hypothetical protein ACYSU6_04065 [Planctomycetota bacterium]